MATRGAADAFRRAATVSIGHHHHRRLRLEAAALCTQLPPGTQLASYVLGARIAEGGMAVVYGAHHRYLGRRAALKVVRPGLDGHGRARERLLREAQLLGRLDHPGAVRIYDFGYLEDDRPWMAMELLDGATLSDRIAQGVIDHGTALSVLRDIARTLSAAHHLGVIHRDLKPDNIFVSDDARTIKVLDWGIAFIRDRHQERFTGPGMALGTPEYLAPEQARGDEVDGRADVYALAVVAHELFAGRRPVRPSTAVDLALGHLHAAPPNQSAPDLPPRLATLLGRMLAQDREHRPDIDAVDRELAAIAASR